MLFAAGSPGVGLFEKMLLLVFASLAKARGVWSIVICW
jgi:hypothetical protein